MFAVLLHLVVALSMLGATSGASGSACEPNLVNVRYGVYPAPGFTVGKILFIGLAREEAGQARVRLLDEKEEVLLDITITGSEVVMSSDAVNRVERAALQSSQGDLNLSLEVNGNQFFTDIVEADSDQGLVYSYKPSVDPRDPSNCRPKPLDPSKVRFIQLSGERVSFTKLKLCYMF